MRLSSLVRGFAAALLLSVSLTALPITGASAASTQITSGSFTMGVAPDGVGGWSFGVRQSSDNTVLPAGVTLRVSDASTVTVGSGSAQAWFGAANQKHWATAVPGSGDLSIAAVPGFVESDVEGGAAASLTWDLLKVEGPGDYLLYTPDGSGAADSAALRLGTGTAADGSARGASGQQPVSGGSTSQISRFTQPGLYCVTYQVSATLTGSSEPTQWSGTVRYAVGDAVSVDAACGTAAPVDPEPVDPEPVDPGPVDPGPTQPGVWDVPNSTVNRVGATVLNAGHVDVASRLNGSELETVIKDTVDGGDPKWRPLDQTVLQLTPGTKTAVPDNPTYAFLGETGSPIWQVSHVQQAGLLWPGWSTESIPLAATTGGVTWSLTDVSGPGDFFIYAPKAMLGGIDVLFSTRDGISEADRFTIPKNTHAHGSWAFSAEGQYCLSMQRDAQLANGQSVTEQFIVAVAVGTADVMGFDPASCAESVETGVVVVPAPTPSETTSTGADAPARELAATECVAAVTVLSSGHIDYATRIVNGRAQSLIGDDTSGSKVYREPADVVMWLKPSSRVNLPAGFSQVGAAGSTLWQVPQTQVSDLIWLGWNTESLNAGNAKGTVRWTLDRVEGPGSVKVYQTGAFGGVETMVLNGAGSSYQIPLGVHAHSNWAFSATGVYRLTTTQSVTLATGETSTDTETMTIVVGDDPATAVGAAGTDCGAPAAALSLPAEDAAVLLAAAQVDPLLAADVLNADQSQGGENAAASVFKRDRLVAILLASLGLLLLLGSGGAGVLWRLNSRPITS